MKKISLLFLVFSGLFFSSCKKEISPELEVTVVDTLGFPAGGVSVKISVDGADRGIVNARIIDSAKTDGFGKAFFKFDNTVLVDASVSRKGVPVDSVSCLCETKRLKRKEENVYERRLVYY